MFYSRHTIKHSELARLTQIVYARETAILAVTLGPDCVEETLGVARSITDPDHIDAVFGIVVRSDLKGSGSGSGSGTVLPHKLIGRLREHGTQRLVATEVASTTHQALG